MSWKTREVNRINNLQWRIQDFPGGGANFHSECAKRFFGQKLHKNKGIWTPGDAFLAHPLRSATDLILSYVSFQINVSYQDWFISISSLSQSWKHGSQPRYLVFDALLFLTWRDQYLDQYFKFCDIYT